jgi:hypothetical protein
MTSPPLRPPAPGTTPSSTPAGSTPSVEALKASLAALIAESQALRQDVHGAEAARRKANTINLGILGLLTLFVALLIAIGWQGNVGIHESRETNQRVADCTTPGGQCHQEGQQRLSGAITALTRISIYVSQCGRLYPGESGPEFDRKMEACVAERLQRATAASPAPSVSPGPR